MKVLVLNCGSSSVRFQLFDTDEERAAAGTERTLARGRIENIGGPALVHYEVEGRRPLREAVELREHKAAVERALQLLTQEGTGVLSDRRDVDAVGHRVVHGGERFQASVRIDEAVLSAIEDCFDLAPLHNPPNVKGYRATSELLGNVPQVAVFDTAFHHTLEPRAYLYALPYVYYERHRIRRYGFHGTSHRYVSERLAERLGRKGDAQLRLLTCHLGNGCSVAAIRGGRSVDTSMGWLAIDIFCYRLRKYLGAYLGVLGGVDGVAFAGGIGENAPGVRARAFEGLEGLGLRLDAGANEAARGREAEISPPGSAARVFVIPTNEEILIARDTCRIVAGLPPS